MFCVIYSFEINPEKRESFIEAWREMTLLIREYEGGLGSRLRQESVSKYIAYAQWPNRATWENASDKLPASANAIRTRMREACTDISTLHELKMVEDLLVRK